MDTDKDRLNDLLCRLDADRGSTGKMHKLLNEVVSITMNNPLILWNEDEVKNLSQIALRVLFFDAIEEEEQEIVWAHLTFAYITQALLKARDEESTDEELFEILKNRLILLHSHDDFFFETIDYFFFNDEEIIKATTKEERRSFVMKHITAMQAIDIITLGNYRQDLGGEEYLLEVEEKVNLKYQFTKEELTEAQLLLDTLFKYIWYKYKKNEGIADCSK